LRKKQEQSHATLILLLKNHGIGGRLKNIIKPWPEDVHGEESAETATK
jgi:hypothetical protein